MEQSCKLIASQVQALEDELQTVNNLLADKIRSIGYKLEALRHTELPASESVISEYLRDDIKKRDIEGDMLALFTRELRTKETQEEILSALLDSAVNCFPLVALFAVRGSVFKGWSSRGFSDSTARTIGSDVFNLTDCAWLLEIIRNGERAENVDLSNTGSMCFMREESSGAWQLFPLRVMGRTSAILFAGETGDSIGRPNAMSVLMDCAALRLENVALKIIKTLNESAPARAAAAAQTVETLSGVSSAPCPPVEISSDVLSASSESEEKTIDIDDETADAAVETLSGVSSAPCPPVEISSDVLSASSESEEKTIDIDNDETADAAAETLSGVSSATNPPVEISTDVLRASSEPEEKTIDIDDDETADAAVEHAAVSTPPDAASSMPLSSLNQQEEKLYAAAKRFAGLLVSEIRLYNEDAVAEGRKQRDLYIRLKKDMDHCREMYEKRAAPTVSCSIDYLHDEFVRILGNGDAGSFGDEYPGPRLKKQTGL